jgi:hypothetical protein
MKEKKEKIASIISAILAFAAFAVFVASIVSRNGFGTKLFATGWILIVASILFDIIEHSYAIKYLKEDIGNISYAINKLAQNVREELYGTYEEETPEEDTKETMIVSPEDFERFSRGEMTKEELLGIKKAVDEVIEAKMKHE